MGWRTSWGWFDRTCFQWCELGFLRMLLPWRFSEGIVLWNTIVFVTLCRLESWLSWRLDLFQFIFRQPIWRSPLSSQWKVLVLRFRLWVGGCFPWVGCWGFIFSLVLQCRRVFHLRIVLVAFTARLQYFWVSIFRVFPQQLFIFWLRLLFPLLPILFWDFIFLSFWRWFTVEDLLFACRW